MNKLIYRWRTVEKSCCPWEKVRSLWYCSLAVKPTGHSKLFALDSIIVHDNCTTNKSLMHQSGKGSLKFKFNCFLLKLSVWGSLVIKIVCFGLSWWFMGIYTYHRILTVFVEYLEPTCWKEKTLNKSYPQIFTCILWHWTPPQKTHKIIGVIFFFYYHRIYIFEQQRFFFPPLDLGELICFDQGLLQKTLLERWLNQWSACYKSGRTWVWTLSTHVKILV